MKPVVQSQILHLFDTKNLWNLVFCHGTLTHTIYEKRKWNAKNPQVNSVYNFKKHFKVHDFSNHWHDPGGLGQSVSVFNDYHRKPWSPRNNRDYFV